MANDTLDLWPTDIAVHVLSPRVILNEQAEALAKKTQGVVRGEVLPGASGKLEQLRFDLLAPAIGFRQRLLVARYSRELPYPLVLIAEPLENVNLSAQYTDLDPNRWGLNATEHQEACLAYSPEDVHNLLRTIFNAPTTRATLFSMIARSNEVTGQARGRTEQDEQMRNDGGKPQ